LIIAAKNAEAKASPAPTVSIIFGWPASNL